MDGVKIENLSNRLMTIRGNSGRFIHLAPKESSSPIDEIEIANNPKIKKLIDSGLISVERAKEEKGVKKQEPPKERMEIEEKGVTEPEPTKS